MTKFSEDGSRKRDISSKTVCISMETKGFAEGGNTSVYTAGVVARESLNFQTSDGVGQSGVVCSSDESADLIACLRARDVI